MTLAGARAEANKTFKETRAEIVAGKVSTRRASEELIRVFWDIKRRLAGRDRVKFYLWFEKKHLALGKEFEGK